MKIPIFEEILLKGSGLKDLLSVIEDSRIGKVPCYINLTNYSAEDLNNTVMNLEQVVLENSLHPRFPYPLYIICTRPVKTLFPTVVRKQMTSAVQFIVQLGRDKEGNRVVTEIIEVCGMEGPTMLIQTIAKREDGFLNFMMTPRTLEKLHLNGGLPLDFFKNI